MTRFIHYTIGDDEYVFITEDEEAPASDFYQSVATLVSDTNFSIEFPVSFPIENPFKLDK